MCRWGCTTTNTTYMCKWCGTRYCKECLRGDFVGLMVEATQCRVCLQKKCQGVRVEYVPRAKDDDDAGGNKKRGMSARSSRSAKSAKSSKSKSAKGSKKKSGKKSGKKKKKK
ncbi:hypothetical protein ACF0H5_011509 [Mactra antiquata]